jgi:hypothetical protein
MEGALCRRGERGSCVWRCQIRRWWRRDRAGESGVRPFSDVRWESVEAQIRGERVRSRCPPPAAAAAAARCGMEATRVCFCCGGDGRGGGADRTGKAGQAATPTIREGRGEEGAEPSYFISILFIFTTDALLLLLLLPAAATAPVEF